MWDYIIFTDLDGTLLDHRTYTYEPALKALSVIKSHQIPLILTSSKTKAEIEKLQSSLTLKDPFIFENGSGVFYNNQVVSFGMHLNQIHDKIIPLQKTFNFNCYSLLPLDQAIQHTGLPEKKPNSLNKDSSRNPLFGLMMKRKKLILYK